MTTYEQTLEYLYASLPMYHREGAAAYKASLDTSRALDIYDGELHSNYRIIHVAGTNGKGSVSHMLAGILRHAGYRVGLFTSPHLVDFRERIRVDGEMISKDFITEYVESRRDLYEELNPSFFEMTTAMAFAYFAHCSVDVAVIEVGMGGRLDSTNVILPELSVITSVGYDHTQFLGTTLEQITNEKCGIIKPQTPLVLGPCSSSRVRSVVFQRAKQNGSQMLAADDCWRMHSQKVEDGLQHIVYLRRGRGMSCEVVTDLLGLYQRLNIATVLTVVELLEQMGFRMSLTLALEALRNVGEATGLMGRWQLLEAGPPPVMCDSAHNADGIQEMVRMFAGIAPDKLHIVLGVVQDKDLDQILPHFPPEAKYYFTQSTIPRALPGVELRNRALGFQLRGETYESVALALEAAKRECPTDGMVFVGGSFFTVAEVLPLFPGAVR